MPLASTPTDLGSLSLEKPLSSGFFFGRDPQRGHARLDRASMAGERCRMGVECPSGHGHPVKPGVTKLRLGTLTRLLEDAPTKFRETVLSTCRHARLDRASMVDKRRCQFLVRRLRAGEAFGADDAQLAQAQPLGTGQYRCGGFVFGLGM